MFNSTEDELVKQEISSFIKKGIIQEVEPVEGQVLLNIFLRENKDGSQRVILNLKFLDETIDEVHFKMDSLKHAISLIKRGCWFTSVDLKDVYFSVKISPEYQKFFRFVFDGKLYEFLALPQGFRDSPRIFTKLLKPALSCLRCLGHTVLAFIDDVGNMSGRVCDCCAFLDNSGVVHQTVKTPGRFSSSTTICSTSYQSSSIWSAASSSAKDETDSMFLVREALENRGIRKDSADIIMSGWREGTKKCCHSYIRSGLNIVIRGVKIPFVPLQTNWLCSWHLSLTKGKGIAA